MTSLEQMTPAVKAWLKGTADTPYGVEDGVRRVMARIPQTNQRGRWWPSSTIPSIRTRPRIVVEPPPPSRPVAWPARGTRPVTARPMLRPATAIVTVALAVTLGGTLLVAQPLDRQGTTAPGAADAALPPITRPAGDGLMTYARDGDIFVGDPTTGDETRIVGGPDEDATPRFSPDGMRIAFVRGDPSRYDARLVVVGIDGSGALDVTPAGWPMQFAWTPDGSALLVNEELAELPSVGGVLTLYDTVHLGVATQTDSGLMVPVLRQAQTLNLWDCSQSIAELAAKARSGKATRDELSSSTLTVTSLGKLGGIVSTPVINHPEVAIVGINRIVERPTVRDGTLQVRRMMNLSSSFDHRVVDGAVAAAYIQRVRQLLEAPATLFID